MKWIWPCVLGVGTVLGTEASAGEFFVTIAGVTGESTQKGHEGQIHVLHFSETWRAATGTGGGSSGAGAGKATIGPVVFTKQQDSASPPFIGRLIAGTHFTSAIFEYFEGRDGGQLTYRITLTDVAVAAMSERTEGERLLDEIQLTFAKAQWETLSPAAVVTSTPPAPAAVTPKPAGSK
jgi:type VI secretion system Hcp family effector